MLKTGLSAASLGKVEFLFHLFSRNSSTTKVMLLFKWVLLTTGAKPSQTGHMYFLVTNGNQALEAAWSWKNTSENLEKHTCKHADDDTKKTGNDLNFSLSHT